MSSYPSNRSSPIDFSKLAELGVASSQVVAHRVARMAMASPVLSARDRKEFSGMVHEKQLAFAQSWMAMWAEGVRAQQTLFNQWLQGVMSMASPMSQSWGHVLGLQHAMQRIGDSGLAPIHRKAMSNSRRLARTSLR